MTSNKEIGEDRERGKKALYSPVLAALFVYFRVFGVPRGTVIAIGGISPSTKLDRVVWQNVATKAGYETLLC